MTRTAARLRRLGRPHTRARALAVVLGGAGLAFAIAAWGLALAPRLAGVLGAWLAILGVGVAVAWALRRARRSGTTPGLARVVERTTDARPGSIESLIARPPAGTSAELFDAADRDGAAAVERAGPVVHGELGRGTRGRLWLGVGAVAVGALVFLATSPDRVGAAAFWNPIRALRDARSPVRLAVDRGAVKRGESVRVTVVVPGATRAVLWTRRPGESWRPAALPLDSAGRGSREIGPLTSDLHLRAAAGRRTSRELLVTVTTPPFLADLSLTARYPAYLARQEEPLMPGPDTVPLPVGTTIVARGTASARLKAATWSSGGARRIALDVKGDGFEGRFVPTASGTWRLDLATATGPIEGSAPELIVRLVPDSAPIVQLPVPGSDTVLPISLRQPLVIDARDDHGLARVVLVTRRMSRTGRPGDPMRTELDVSGAGDRAVLQTELDLRDRGLLPGDTLRVLVEAWDDAPTSQVGKSPELALRLPTMEELRADARSAARDVAATAESLAAAQTGLAERTRDLAQGRARDEVQPTPARPSGPPPGALPFEARERAEEVARQQAEVAERIEELREAVEDIARAARAAGVGDTAFEARLAEVRELLRRAVTPELEERLRELREALDRLDPEATREALRRLAEAQEELRRELERSRELFERAALEGELASLAADAEALQRRQEEWNRNEGPQADSAAAAVEEALAQLAESLAAGIQQAGREIAPNRLTPQGDAARRAQAAMDRAARAAQAGESRQAVEQGETAARELEDLPEELRQRRDSLAAAWRQETLNALDRALSETAALAERQEEVAGALRNGQAGPNTRARQAAVEEGTQAIEQQIREAGGRHALVSPALERALGYAEHQMRAARQQLEQGDPNAAAAASLAQEALDALNATAYALARSRADVAAARSGSGFQEAVEQLARMAGQQQGLNSDAQGMMPMMGAGGQAMLQQMRALAARQRALAEQLERLQAGGMSGSAGALAEEARELARRLEQGGLDRQTVERQERLYRRMLDAGRTLSGEEPDERKERVSRSATGDSLRRPPALRPGATGAGPRVRYPTWEELRGLTAAERRLVLEYFRRLNEPR
ncbi:MAG TPA: DUF4175 family protein [Gemmatimonadales bacterium]